MKSIFAYVFMVYILLRCITMDEIHNFDRYLYRFGKRKLFTSMYVFINIVTSSTKYSLQDFKHPILCR